MNKSALTRKINKLNKELEILKGLATHNSEVVRNQALKCIATVKPIIKSLEEKRAT